MKEVYALKWTGNNTIHGGECYTDHEYARHVMNHANKKLPWIHRMCGHRYVLTTLKVRGQIRYLDNQKPSPPKGSIRSN